MHQKDNSFDRELFPNVHPVFEDCHEGNFMAVKEHLDSGVPVDIEGDHPDLASTAITQGHVHILRLLIERGLDVNASKGSMKLSLLQIVPNSPHEIESATLLLNSGADPNSTDASGCTPLMDVAGAGRLDLLKLLLSHRADFTVRDMNEWTAFFHAAVEGWGACADHLIRIGGDVNAVDVRNKSALHWAAQRGNIQAVKWLLAHGADKTILDDFDNTALDWAQENGHTEVVKLLS